MDNGQVWLRNSVMIYSPQAPKNIALVTTIGSWGYLKQEYQAGSVAVGAGEEARGVREGDHHSALNSRSTSTAFFSPASTGSKSSKTPAH